MITSWKYVSFLGLLLVLLFLGFLYTKVDDKKNALVVYSSRKENLLSTILENFTAETGISIKYVEDEAPQLISRMASEIKHPAADVFLTADAVNLIIAKKKGLIEKVHSAYLSKRIPSNLRDDSGFWFGLTKRARIFAYNKNLVSANELTTYADLANDKWRNSILVRSSNSPYNQSLIAFMIATHGEPATRAWIAGMVNNMARKPSGGDIDQIYAVASGEGKIAIVNSYYLARIFSSEDPKDKKAASIIGVFFPDQQAGGSMMNISGAAVINGSKHKENAIKLLEFLAGDYAQSMYANINHEYPVVEKVKISDELKKWGKFSESTLPLSKLEEFFELSVKIAQEEGWN